MNMEITNKILAGTLALMSAFTSVSAEPVKIEKPTDSPIITQYEKSTGKKLVKGVIIAVAGVVAVAAGVGTGVLVRDIFETRRMEENGTFLDVSNKIFEWYSDPEVKSYVKKNKDTELGKTLTYLFDVLDGKKSTNRWCILRNLKCVCRYMGISGSKFGCNELRCFLNESLNNGVGRFSFECLTPNSMLLGYLHLLGNEDINKYSVCVGKFANFSKYNKKFMKIEFTSSNLIYDLKAIVMFDKENHCFNTAYLKQEDGKWHRCSFDGIKEEPIDDDLIIYMLEKYGENVNLIYMKTCQNSL